MRRPWFRFSGDHPHPGLPFLPIAGLSRLSRLAMAPAFAPSQSSITSVFIHHSWANFSHATPHGLTCGPCLEGSLSVGSSPARPRAEYTGDLKRRRASPTSAEEESHIPRSLTAILQGTGPCRWPCVLAATRVIGQVAAFPGNEPGREKTAGRSRTGWRLCRRWPRLCISSRAIRALSALRTNFTGRSLCRVSPSTPQQSCSSLFPERVFHSRRSRAVLRREPRATSPGGLVQVVTPRSSWIRSVSASRSCSASGMPMPTHSTGFPKRMMIV